MKNHLWPAYLFLTAAAALLFWASQTSAQVVVAPEMADLVSPKVTDTVTFDAPTGLFTYSYSIKNLNSAQQNIAIFALEIGAPVLNVVSPAGWQFLAVNSGTSAFSGWLAVSTALDANGNLLESPSTIGPGETLAGFSFQSPIGPQSATYYAQGFVQIPSANDPEDIPAAGYDVTLLDFRQNSKTGTTDAPVSECGDGTDNDGDGNTDYPADAGCRDALWPYEDPQCNNGIDDDGNSLADFGLDPGCATPFDLSEGPDCSDGIDNSFDLLIDYPADPACHGPLDQSEEPDCGDGFDNDNDGLVDTDDPSCPGVTWLQEDPPCADGTDNDGDMLVDLMDPGCGTAFDQSEEPDCSDGIDNDGDGLIDLADTDGCPMASNLSEVPDCSDSIDNDLDGLVDIDDPDCGTPAGVTEVPEPNGLLAIAPGLALLRLLGRRRARSRRLRPS